MYERGKSVCSRLDAGGYGEGASASCNERGEGKGIASLERLML